MNDDGNDETSSGALSPVFAVLPGDLESMPGISTHESGDAALREAGRRIAAGETCHAAVILRAPVERLALHAIVAGGTRRHYTVDPGEAEADAACWNRLSAGVDAAAVIALDAWIQAP